MPGIRHNPQEAVPWLSAIQSDNPFSRSKKGSCSKAVNGQLFEDVPILMTSGCANISMAVQAMRAGAIEFFEKADCQPNVVGPNLGGHRP
jgi:DNA-binding NtrC family response regulator